MVEDRERDERTENELERRDFSRCGGHFKVLRERVVGKRERRKRVGGEAERETNPQQ